MRRPAPSDHWVGIFRSSYEATCRFTCVTACCFAAWELTTPCCQKAAPVLVPRNTPAMLAAQKAIEAGFGKKPVFIREGGSIPVVNMIKKRLRQQNILLLGRGSPDDGAHSPNERFCIEDFYRAIRTAAALFSEMAGRKRAAMQADGVWIEIT